MKKKSTNKSWWPKGIVLFFMVVFTFNFWFFYKAKQSSIGNVEEDTYNKSLQYQGVIDKKFESFKLGWRADYRYEKEQLFVEILDADTKAVEGLDVSAAIIPLSKKGGSQKLKLTFQDAVYVGKIKLTQGLHLIKLSAVKGGKKFYDEFQFQRMPNEFLDDLESEGIEK